MANTFIRSLALVGAVGFVPLTAASFAQTDVNSYRELDQFMSVFERVKGEYVDQVDDATLIRGAIDGMLASLDPHSSYMNAREFRNMMTTTDGNYGGLGLTVTMEDGAVKVMAATPGAPASTAGLKTGDFITHIDGRLFYGGTLDEAVEKMRGNPGTSVRLTIVRPGRDRPFDVNITRAIIDIPAVRSEIRDGVGILTVTTFSRVTTEATQRAMADIERQLGHPPLGYILDLRSNPGGLLDQAIGLSDLFLERGEVVSQRGRRRTDIERYYARPGDAAHGLPIVVLVDAGTASASEIVAGALQDHRRAIVMGVRTFGKGSVQTLIPLGGGDTALRLTTARYYTPSGRSVQEGGIAPDIVVPQLTDPDYQSRNNVRESDLRRHLINEIGVQEDLIQNDGRPDPRFALTAAQLTERHITDYQLYYALQTISRLGHLAPAPQIAATPRPPQRQPLIDVRTPLGLARALALLVPAAALAAAYGSQYLGGLVPCEMCWWQRYAHIAALAFALIALVAGGRPLVWLAALAIAVSGAIGFYHAGVELDYFEGFTQCTSPISAGSNEDFLKAIMNAPLVRCDDIQWSFLGISMAGWNAIFSLGSALLILWLSLRRNRTT